MERHILPGLTRLPWTALGIKDYIKDITKGENSLQAVYKQLKMVEKEIQSLIDQIEMFDMFPYIRPKNYVDAETGLPDDTWIYPCKTYFVEVENERLERTAQVSRIYDRIGPILMKLEYLILGTSTGKSVVMTTYYNYWEKKIFKCIQTCIPCPPQRDTEATGNEFYVFSYFEDVLRVVSINDVTLLIQDTIYRLTQDINIQKYDEKFFFFEDIIAELNGHVKFVDVGAIRVNLRPVIKQVQDHAQEWKNILGHCIATKTRMNMYDLKNQIDSLRATMNMNIKGLEDFKLVMATITLVQAMTITAEVRYRGMQELFNMLRQHDIDVSTTNW
ncbi:putative ciliary dynein heavy chain [Operophtera brumata]|uniref:Putative ciliary dynein heavy chain n=1 Tax=Operophtera brumata TaxID=104452 RepID=A0A0L7L8K7_OPEBR|nr:putative ciliary dynein heavy chain [Operophtera brumata]